MRVNKAPTKARRRPPPNYDDISDEEDESSGGDSDRDLDKKPAAKTDVKQVKAWISTSRTGADVA